MDATSRADALPPRRFITRHDIEDAAARGRSLSLTGRDTLTDEAAQRATELDITIDRGQVEGQNQSPIQERTSPPTADRLRAAVRNAVVAELRAEPAGLDAAIDRVMERRGTTN